jgi:hypothetical protein
MNFARSLGARTVEQFRPERRRTGRVAKINR